MDKIINILISLPYHGFFFFLKIAFILVSGLMLIAIFLLIRRASWMRFKATEDFIEIVSKRSFDERKNIQEWNKIKNQLEKGEESELKMAVIQADNLFNDVLKRLGYGSVDLGENLDRMGSGYFPSVEDVRRAHALRNNIMYNSDFRLSREEARNAVEIFNQGLQELEEF